jgi:hypothetical protein
MVPIVMRSNDSTDVMITSAEQALSRFETRPPNVGLRCKTGAGALRAVGADAAQRRLTVSKHTLAAVWDDGYTRPRH